jgi:hypothetical protein
MFTFYAYISVAFCLEQKKTCGIKAELSNEQRKMGFNDRKTTRGG